MLFFGRPKIILFIFLLIYPKSPATPPLRSRRGKAKPKSSVEDEKKENSAKELEGERSWKLITSYYEVLIWVYNPFLFITVLILFDPPTPPS